MDTSSLTNVQAIKLFFARRDAFSPNGQETTLGDFKGLTAEEREAWGAMAKEELSNPTVEVYA